MSLCSGRNNPRLLFTLPLFPFSAELNQNVDLLAPTVASLSNCDYFIRWAGASIKIMKSSSSTAFEWQPIKFEKVIQQKKMYVLRNIKYVSNWWFSAKILPQNFMSVVKPDPGVQRSNPEPIVYRCRKCRRIIAAKSNLITHTPATADLESKPDNPKHVTFQADIHVPSETASDESKLAAKGLLDRMDALCIHSNSEKSSGCEPEPMERRCKEILFIEPLAWMSDVGKQTQGKLNCPKCQSKLGNYTWINSCQCPCGKNVSPAFYLVPSKVELTHSVQNVEITV